MEMLVVPVVVQGAAVNEWSLLEFQGDVLPTQARDLRGLDLGTLRYGQGGHMTLRLGNHVLTGHATKLSPPCAILAKNERLDVEMDDNEAASETDEVSTTYEVVGIARTRVLFASRPKPVLT